MHLHCNPMQMSCTVLFVTELVDSSIDWAAVESWLAARGVADDKVTGIEQIGGGTQNLMFKFQCGDAHLVLRRGPWHLRPHTNDALRREARVLSALAGTGVPIPRLVAAEPDESVLGSVFYLMEPVDGFNASVALPLLHESNPDIRRAMGFEAVDALVALGAINAERSASATSASPKGSWSGRCLSGWAHSTSTRHLTATRVTSCRTSTTSRPGWSSIARRSSSPASCTATSTWQT